MADDSDADSKPAMESERKYRLIAENAVDIIFTMDLNFRFTYFSPAVERISGFTPAEVMARSIEQIVTPESLPGAYAAIKRSADARREGDYRSHETIELELVRKDGTTVWTENEISFMFDEAGEAVGIIGVTRDISRRRRVENELMESEERFRSLIQSVSDMIFILAPDGKISYESPSASRILGYPEGHFLGKTPFALVHPDDLAILTQEMDLVARSTNSGLPTEFRLKTPEDEWRWLEALASNRFDNPAIQGIVITVRDISERKRSEAEKEKLNAQLLQAKKMEAVGQMAGGIAHDFNNMLSVVIGQTELAILRADLDEDLRGRLKAMNEAAHRSAQLVRQMLGFARKQTISPQVLDINTTISGMLTMLHRLIGEDIDMVWVPGSDVGRVKIDPSQIDQILANLMVNSRDAINGVGAITIETGYKEIDEAYCRAHLGFLPGKYVVLSVSDNGCGMNKETIAQIFDPFFTTKPAGKGTGLGMATVYGIVKQNNGFINVYSEPGQGSTFTIFLPVVDELPDPAGANADTVLEGTGTILVVEDDPSLLNMTRSILEQLGYTVIAAETPEHAIKIGREQKIPVDLLITDVVMPQMNGMELVRCLQKTIPDLKYLFMSGYPADIIAHRGVLGSGLHFLQKPFSIREIAAKVREAIDGRPPAILATDPILAPDKISPL
jgi:two-component system, cell cycle sensor histidine kinase and response regulator CckA